MLLTGFMFVVGVVAYGVLATRMFERFPSPPCWQPPWWQYVLLVLAGLSIGVHLETLFSAIILALYFPQFATMGIMSFLLVLCVPLLIHDFHEYQERIQSGYFSTLD